MHIMDHNGVARIIIASILMRFIKYEHRLGSNQETRLDALNVEIEVFWSTRLCSNPLRNLKRSNLTPNGMSQWAELHGPLVKAANTRHFCPCLEVITRKWADSGSLEDRCTIKLVSSLNRFYHVLYSADMFMTPAEQADFEAACLSIGKQLQCLRELSRQRGDMFFHVTPKCHFMQHLPFQARCINPRFVQCYCAESLIGRITKICKSCAEGPYKGTLQKSALIKYLVVLCSVFKL